MDASDELLEEPLFLDGIVIRRWSDVARLPRPGGPDTGAAEEARPSREVRHRADVAGVETTTADPEAAGR